MRSRKALSPVVASILLMVLAIAGSMIVYRFFISASDVLTTSLSYQVIDARLQTFGGGEASFYMSIKNVGSEVFTIESVEMTRDGTSWVQVPVTSLPQQVEPGDTATLDGVIPANNITFTPGVEYVVRITIRTPDGDVKVIQEVIRAS